MTWLRTLAILLLLAAHDEKPQRRRINWRNFFQIRFQHVIEALLTLALVFVAVRQAEVSDQQAKIAQGQLDLQGREFEMSQRPWVSGDVSVGAVTWREGTPTFPVRVVMKNSGHSPALSAEVIAETHTGLDLNRLYSSEKGIVEAVNRQQQSSAIPLFPGETSEIVQTISLSPDEIETFRKTIRSENSVTSVPVAVVVVIDYRFAADNSHHQTGYMLAVNYFDPANPRPGMALPVGKDLPASNLRSTFYPFGQFAN